MKKSNTFRKILIVLAVLFILLIILLLINYKAFKIIEKKEIKTIFIQDECSVLFNNIIHNIKDEAGCESLCISECFTREMKFYDSEFTLNQESCNVCNCYCK